MNMFENHLRKRDKRGEMRYAVRVPVITEEGEGIQERILNYSAVGCCITSPVVFRENDVLALTIPAWPETRGPALKIGRVVWRSARKDAPDRYGIKFCTQENN